MKTSINSIIRVTMISLVLIFGLSCGLALAHDEVCVYDQEDYRGDRFCTTQSIRNLKDENWNDIIASIEVDRGMNVILYEDSNFRGRSLQVMEDHDYIGHRLDHAVSSIEIIRPGHENYNEGSRNHQAQNNSVGNMRLERNVKRNGGDYTNFTVANAHECARACDRDSQCRSFNYGKAQRDCWLKNSNPKGVPNNTVISGFKTR